MTIKTNAASLTFTRECALEWTSSSQLEHLRHILLAVSDSFLPRCHKHSRAVNRHVLLPTEAGSRLNRTLSNRGCLVLFWSGMAFMEQQPQPLSGRKPPLDDTVPLSAVIEASQSLQSHTVNRTTRRVSGSLKPFISITNAHWNASRSDLMGL